MCELNSLWISYSHLSEELVGVDTSWVDEIYMKDIVRALASKDGIFEHKCRLMDSPKYCMVEATASYFISEFGYLIQLAYSPRKRDGGKNDVHPGVTNILWESEEKAFIEVPYRVSFVSGKSNNEEEIPVFRFLPHRDSNTKYFTFIDYKGTKRKMTEVFHKEQFEDYKKLFAVKLYKDILGYVAKVVDGIEEDKDFVIGWLFPIPWPKELMKIYDTLLVEYKDEKETFKHAGYMLSGLVQTAILESGHRWETYKMPFGKRTLVYSRIKDS